MLGPSENPAVDGSERAAHRETSPSYSRVVCQSEDWRVIVCCGEWQWIVQRRAGSGARARWQAVRYFRQRWALMAFWHASLSTPETESWPELEALPEDFAAGGAS